MRNGQDWFRVTLTILALSQLHAAFPCVLKDLAPNLDIAMRLQTTEIPLKKDTRIKEVMYSNSSKNPVQA